MSSYRQMYMVNQDQYNILQKITNPSAQISVPMNIPSTVVPSVSESVDPAASKAALSEPKDAFMCTICSKSFDKRLNLKYHKWIHKKPTCEIDNKEFDHSNILAHHMKKQHADGYKCNICGEIKKSQSELNKHLKTHKKPKKPKNLLISDPIDWATL